MTDQGRRIRCDQLADRRDRLIGDAEQDRSGAPADLRDLVASGEPNLDPGELGGPGQRTAGAPAADYRQLKTGCSSALPRSTLA